MAVASAESFSRAAEELHVAQSAVSRQVGLLEREIVRADEREPSVGRAAEAMLGDARALGWI
jgi:hypothetical protein